MNYRKYHKDNYIFYKRVVNVLEAKHGDCPIVREARKLAIMEEAYYHLSQTDGYEKYIESSVKEDIFYGKDIF